MRWFFERLINNLNECLNEYSVKVAIIFYSTDHESFQQKHENGLAQEQVARERPTSLSPYGTNHSDLKIQ